MANCSEKKKDVNNPPCEFHSEQSADVKNMFRNEMVIKLLYTVSRNIKC